MWSNNYSGDGYLGFLSLILLYCALVITKHLHCRAKLRWIWYLPVSVEFYSFTGKQNKRIVNPELIYALDQYRVSVRFVSYWFFYAWLRFCAHCKRNKYIVAGDVAVTHAWHILCSQRSTQAVFTLFVIFFLRLKRFSYQLHSKIDAWPSIVI